MLIFLALFSGLAFGQSPNVEVGLSDLNDICTSIKKGEAGACSEQKKAAAQLAKYCQESQRAFKEANKKVEAKIAETEKWLKKKRLRHESEDTVVFRFSLSDDPGFPLIDADKYHNAALKISYENMSLGRRLLDEVLSECRDAKFQKAYQKLDAFWEGENDSVSYFHNSLGREISNRLFMYQRAVEARGFEEAIGDVNGETPVSIERVE